MTEILLDNSSTKHTEPAKGGGLASVVTIPLTRIQRLISRRMSESKSTKPCFYIESKADVTELMAMRPKLRKALGVKITSNAFYIRALALAAKKFPLMLGTLVGDHIKIADAINVGFAVDAPQGLVVPVIKAADQMALAEIARMEKSLTNSARSNKLTLEQTEAEAIALSNLGVYGVDSFVPIVPPQAGTILAVGNVIRTATIRNNKSATRKMVSLTLAVDSRIINATYAAQFLSFVTSQLQNPQELV